MRVRTSRRWFGFATTLLGLALGCGETTRDRRPLADDGSAVAEHGGSAAGGSVSSASGGAISDTTAGPGGDSPAAGGANGVAGLGVAHAGASAGGAGEGADGGDVAGSTDVAGSGGAGEDHDKIVLFDGSPETFSNWHPRNGGMQAENPWINNGDGTMTVNYARLDDIVSKTPFTNVFVHLEYWSPKYDYSPGTHFTMRGNSGVFLKGSYELTIVDTFGLTPQPYEEEGFCGAINDVSKPLAPACKPGGEWNAYDIEFRAQVCANGVKTLSAEFVEVRLNGILVQQHVAVDHVTQAGLSETCEPRGILLQATSTIVPVSFRNIWAIPRN